MFPLPRNIQRTLQALRERQAQAFPFPRSTNESTRTNEYNSTCYRGPNQTKLQLTRCHD